MWHISKLLNLHVTSKFLHEFSTFFLGSRSGGVPSSSPNLYTILEQYVYKVNVKEYPPRIYVVKMNTFNCQINAKILKIWSFLVCLSVLVAFKITKVDISCIITCDAGPYCLNFITCIRIYDPKEKKIMITRNIDSKSSLTFSSKPLCVLRPV